MAKSILDQLKEHQDAIAKIKAEAVKELQGQRAQLEAQIAAIDSQIEELTGKAPKAGKRAPKAASGGKPFPWTTKAELAAAIEDNGGKIGFRKKTDADFAAKLEKLTAGDKAFTVKEAGAWCFVSHK